MVNKALNDVHKKYKETFTRTKGEHEPEDHHIAGVIMLLMLIIILLSGVIFLLLQEDSRKTKLIQELVVQSSNDYSSYRYSIEEFKGITGLDMLNLDTVQQYMFKENFEEVKIDSDTVSGRKAVGCYQDVFRRANVCRTYSLTYNSGDDFVVVGVERRVLE